MPGCPKAALVTASVGGLGVQGGARASRRVIVLAGTANAPGVGVHSGRTSGCCAVGSVCGCCAVLVVRGVRRCHDRAWASVAVVTGRFLSARKARVSSRVPERA
jgi:hypothetical protein